MRKKRGLQSNGRMLLRRRVCIGMVLAGLAVSVMLTGQWLLFQRGMAARSSELSTPPPVSEPTVPREPDNSRYLYFVLKQPDGFVLARAHVGANNQPIDSPQIVAPFDNAFGQSTTDSIVSLQTSPDGRYLAIDGTYSDGELLWIFDTSNLTLKRVPASVSGTFLHWFPNTSGLFLYRPMFPLGPGAPLDRANWHPGLWLGNAESGTFINIDIHLPSTFLVDAIASPNGSQIVYSTSGGLGQGSDIWSVDRHGTHSEHLLKLSNDAQSIAGMFTWSPDGQSIAYERLGDSPTPFLPAGLWLMDQHGGHQRPLAQADGGHGFVLRWSPDSSKIAFVARTNLTASMADQSLQELQSAVNVVDVSSGRVWSVASPAITGVQLNINPVWSANNAQITFAAFNPLNPVIGGTVHYWSVQATAAGSIHPHAVQVSSPITHVIASGG